MARMRTPFQGLWNVVRFNWHFYVLALVVVAVLALGALFSDGWLQLALLISIIGASVLTLTSLIVTYWVYDMSNLYSLDWLDKVIDDKPNHIVNINAGFDETSGLLQAKYPTAKLTVLDFYDPVKHTEVSIKRARKAYPPYAGTVTVATSLLPLTDDSVDDFLGILAIHEIRDETERIDFLKEAYRILKPNGQIIITEHLRDTANFMAYNMGAFHFHPKATWLRAFLAAGFIIEQETKITPFISTFILRKNGTTS